MALTAEQRAQIFADLLFKEVATGKSSSSELTAFFEELIDSQQLIFPSRIVADEALIPQTAIAVPNVIEEITDLQMLPIPGSNSRAFYHPDLVGIIPFNFGDGSSYIYQLSKDDGSPIPFGQNDWFFNPNAGVLYFMDGFPSGVTQALPPSISCFKYIGKRGIVNSLPLSRSIYVDPTYGDDLTARPYNEHTPFSSVTAAEAVASPGDVIHFRPGVYTDTNLGKDQITYYLESGAIMQNLVDSEPSTFTDETKGDIKFKVCGYGYFILQRNWNVGNWNVEIVKLVNNSRVDFEGYKCAAVGDDGGIFKATDITGEIRVKVDELYSGSLIAYVKDGGYINIRARKAILSREFQAASNGRLELYIDNVYTNVPHSFSTFHQTFHTKENGKIYFEGTAHYDPDSPHNLTALCQSQHSGLPDKSCIHVKGILNIITHKWFGFTSATTPDNNVMIFEGEVNLGLKAADDITANDSNGRIVARNLVVKSESPTRATGIIDVDTTEFHAESTTFILSADELTRKSKAIFTGTGVAGRAYLKTFFSNGAIDPLINNQIPLGLVDVSNPNIKE